MAFIIKYIADADIAGIETVHGTLDEAKTAATKGLLKCNGTRADIMGGDDAKGAPVATVNRDA